MDTVELGIIPLGASLNRLVITEDWHAELWLDDVDSVAAYMRVWKTLRESAECGADVHKVISAARRALNPWTVSPSTRTAG